MRIPSNRLKSVLNFAKSELANIFDEREIQSFFYLLCEHFLGLDKTAVILNTEYALSESELLKFNFAIKDLKKEKPIQYILGSTEFYGLPIKVNKNTLIPRPETEELVQWIIEKESSNQSIRLLDIGTGSGCIAISLAKNIPQAKVTAIDLSEEALKVAQENNQELHAKVSFELIDILNPPKSFTSKFDVIVSNPPYVLEKEKALMKKNVLDYEPDLALFVKDEDPLLFYRKIIAFAQKHLVSKGKLYFEINEKLGVKLSDLLSTSGYTEIEIREDLFNRPRMVCATKKA